MGQANEIEVGELEASEGDWGAGSVSSGEREGHAVKRWEERGGKEEGLG